MRNEREERKMKDANIKSTYQEIRRKRRSMGRRERKRSIIGEKWKVMLAEIDENVKKKAGKEEKDQNDKKWKEIR